MALGLHARLWLPAARPPAHPARGRQELVPVLAAHHSSQPCRVPHHVTGHPPGPPHPRFLAQSRIPCATIQSGFSITQGWLQQGCATRGVAPHSSCYGAVSILPCHPSGQGRLVHPKRKKRGERTTGGRRKASLGLPQQVLPCAGAPSDSQGCGQEGAGGPPSPCPDWGEPGQSLHTQGRCSPVLTAGPGGPAGPSGPGVPSLPGKPSKPCQENTVSGQGTWAGAGRDPAGTA